MKHRGETDAGCEDPSGAINRYLIVPTPTSDELTVWLHQTDESSPKQMSCKQKQALPPTVTKQAKHPVGSLKTGRGIVFSEGWISFQTNLFTSFGDSFRCVLKHVNCTFWLQ